MFQGYQNKQYHKAEKPENLDCGECSKLKACIAAANESSKSQSYNYTSFNQAGTPTFCVHQFFKE
jgi:hypothetical protein